MELNSLPGLIVSSAGTVSFPKNLFKDHESEIYSFDEESCKTVALKTIYDVSSKKIFSAYYTNSDECDGGNSYGVIVQGSEPDSSKSIAVIRDSAIECLPKE